MKKIMRLARVLLLAAPGPLVAEASAQTFRPAASVQAVGRVSVVIPSAPSALAPSALSASVLASALSAPAASVLAAAPAAAPMAGLSAPQFAPFGRAEEPRDGGQPGEPRWKQKARSVLAKTRQVLRDTPAEVAVVGAIGLMVGLGLGWHHESAREASIPVGFSEIHQMERDAQAEGRQMGPMAKYLAGTNDMTMNVFNAWNTANANTLAGSPVRNFASELDYNAGLKMKIHHYELPDYFKMIPGQSDEARRLLEPYEQVRRQAADANGHLSRTWDESHQDVTHTEWRTRTVDDGNGESHTETYTEEVYDHTNHSYSYDRDRGEAASSSLDVLKAKGGKASFTEAMRIARQTNADGEYAAETSRGLRQALSPEEAMKYASAWRDGSTLMTNLPVIHGRLSDLARDGDQWRGDKRTAHDEYYRTNSHSDSGPREYQTVERALSHGQDLERAVTEVLDGVDYTKAMTPVLEAKIHELIAVQLDGKPGDAKKLSKEVLTIAKAIYAKNFKGGFDVERFRAGVVLLASLLGALAGGLAGFGWDRLAARRGWWRSASGGTRASR
ncbi:MAG: hypothetical protein A2V88_00590 [Elusimicrobia bacterium RBG_16_66_12]|nr:MAG: hypothetical protein A2V88_00590 [Elusimicrobia bacterium RBG_16_66_12]